ncbi:hypothetical protein IF2G_03361 [Cordyceps javanica]|nr:hypothetical protein IF2G_03361 [Cordyceps javanica]
MNRSKAISAQCLDKLAAATNESENNEVFSRRPRPQLSLFLAVFHLLTATLFFSLAFSTAGSQTQTRKKRTPTLAFRLNLKQSHHNA